MTWLVKPLLSSFSPFAFFFCKMYPSLLLLLLPLACLFSRVKMQPPLFSELMVEFMERATRLLLADAPAPTTLVQQFRENPPSAKDIGRVAGAYQHHAL